MGSGLNKLCRWLGGVADRVCTPPQVECARFETVAQSVCDAVQTITQTVCDATTTITQTVCDATQTVTQTICDATTTVTNKVCDSFGSIPIIGGLICLISHVVSTVVCAASHVVSTIVCTVSHIVSTVVCTLSHVVSSTICIAAHLVTSTLCAVWAIVKAAACVFVGGAASLVCAVSAIIAGPGRILSSSSQPAGSTRRRSASAWSFALTEDGGADPPYEEEGVHVAYAITGGDAVEWAVGAAALAPLDFRADDLPSFADPPGPGALSVSYDDMRRGDWAAPPPLDMIAAGGDRAIAKRPKVDDIYIAVTAKPYVHRVGDRALLLPQSFFKLDPELGTSGARTEDLVAHVTIDGDDERHPATERFPFFRAVFNLGKLHIGIPVPSFLRQALGTSQFSLDTTLFKGAGATGLWESMDAQFPPRVWQKVDLRPPRNTTEPPARFPSYTHVVYDTNNPRKPPLERRSVAYTAVLDLGIGLSHLHEQHDNRFGGELDNLSDKPWFTVLGVKAPISDDAAYQFANGPIQDYGGWVDGTCIYYLLVRLRKREAVDPADPATLRDAYAILWSDEQSAFTERWRVLHPDDWQFQSPFKPIVGVVKTAADRFYKGAPFEVARYWCPLTEGHVTEDSRMAVTRQVVLLTGRDPATGADELYSIHFSWPTMDRTWRWRAIVPGATVRPAEDADEELGAVLHPDTLQLREDTTISFAGRDASGLAGRWFQRYLPADGQERPSVEQRMQQAEGSKPSDSYDFPWNFFAEDVFTAADRRFSHLGVYEPVRSRIQFYRVSLPETLPVTEREIEDAVWEDAKHALQIEHERLDWQAVADFLGGNGQALKHVSVRSTHPSIYNDPLAFKVVRRPGLGWILMYFDKRDDKLIGFDGLPVAGVELTDRRDPPNKLTITVNEQLRNNVRELHGVKVADETDAVSPPQVSSVKVTSTRSGRGTVGTVEIVFDLARGPQAAKAYGTYDEWVAMNVWRVKLGALVPAEDGGLEPEMLADLVRSDAFFSDGATQFRGTWTPGATDQRNGLLATLLTPEGRVRYGTSVWFVGATGLACCADATVFEVKR